MLKGIFKSFANHMLWLTSGLLLSACAQSVNHPVITNSETTASLVSGGAGGTLAGAATALGNPPGAVLGGIVGGYANSKTFLASRLQAMGAQIVQVGDTTSILIPADYVFNPKNDLLKYELLYGREPILNLTARLLNKYGQSAIKVAVSTDDIGGANDNALLTSRQAERVASYLYRQGVNAWRLYPSAYGETDQLASNRYVMGSFHNRMIEITTNPNITRFANCPALAQFLTKKQVWQYEQDS
ncbi:MAG: OmpA family protein [Legionellales bacterium]|nr:OmpA family protein [Legionellales bacterium]